MDPFASSRSSGVNVTDGTRPFRSAVRFALPFSRCFFLPSASCTVSSSWRLPSVTSAAKRAKSEPARTSWSTGAWRNDDWAVSRPMPSMTFVLPTAFGPTSTVSGPTPPKSKPS